MWTIWDNKLIIELNTLLLHGSSVVSSPINRKIILVNNCGWLELFWEKPNTLAIGHTWCPSVGQSTWSMHHMVGGNLIEFWMCVLVWYLSRNYVVNVFYIWILI